jgi:site-specific DNA recombinase
MARRPRQDVARPAGVRCAVYTRKSSEDGLEQAFNSLDAQREACEAYILSQRHEGWTLVRTAYDDGGFSGGTMERPGLKRLLADVEAGRVDVIVVYKVDRLTRALSDFARIVDILDARGASFVSVTQAFNTTTSMGRLTLNVLLSFAQFEREVTGERIRDKIAASKKKGMWMGGPVPLGYEVVERRLVVNEADAATVRHIFGRYLELGSARPLIEELRTQGCRTRLRPQADGSSKGGIPFERGALFHLLGNRVYIGEVVHKGESYPGEHPAIIDRELWEAVQDTIARNSVNRTRDSNIAQRSLLAGLLRDGHGRRMSPSHAVKAGRRYRYYITPASELSEGAPPAWRLPAQDVETIVITRLRQLLGSRAELRSLVQPVDPSAAALQRALACASVLQGKFDQPEQRRAIVARTVRQVRISSDAVALEIDARALLSTLGAETSRPIAPLLLSAPAARIRQGKEVRLMIASGDGESRPSNGPLAALIVEAHAFRDIVLASPEESIDQIAKRLGRCRSRSAKLLRLSFLAPDIVAAIVDGQPVPFGVRTLLHQALPSRWVDQRTLLGIA